VSGRTSTVDLVVRYGETDQMGIVYHPNYLIWCEIGRTELMRDLGARYRDVEDAGIRLAVAEVTVRYIAPARYDDRITVTTELTELGSRGITFDYVIAHAESGTRLATARTKLIATDRSGRVVTLPRPVRDALGAASRV
jgi:acyl-CoA thioester hydrolase